MIHRRTLLGAAAALPVARTALAQDGGMTPWPPTEHFKLWPGRPLGAPERLPVYSPVMAGSSPRRELHLTGVAEPVVGVYRAARPDGRAVLALPGGGYRFVSIENEGINVARALNPAGITVFALAYRLPGEGWARRADVPLQDAQRAMRLIRASAGRYGVDPAKLGTVGFSAGGHLAASLTVGHGDRVYAPVDAADSQSARPAFSGLVYPVTSLGASTAHRGSTEMLLGPSPEPATVARYDTPRRVAADAPPLFLVHATDDGVVPLEQTLAMIAAARAAKVPVEAHLFERGGHGFGALFAPERSPARLWTDLFERWTRETVSRSAG